VKRKVLISAFLMSVAFSGVAFAQDLRIGLNEDPDSLDPAQSRTFVSSLVYEQLCSRLFNTDANMQIVPELATAWTWSDDGLTLALTLREGVVHHDGTSSRA
jgi:peptide/nickel transport system substrate-binding protein